jgi:DNA-binding NtrC family response regulator
MNHDTETVLYGESPAVEQLRSEIQAAARSDASILIEGETGVGKDVTARLIHERGQRHAQRFVAVNCAGLPDSLLESELFGHVRGSFTGAYRDKVGLAAGAHGGTLFLDEVGEMSPRMQAVLLRFCESGEIHPVGSDQIARSVNVRLISATNRTLAKEIAGGTFRGDLYYRLNVIRLWIPPLRDRGNDILLLLKRFLQESSRFHRAPEPTVTKAALDSIAAYCWPGNVRELKNFAEQLVVRGFDRPVDSTDLPAHILASARSASQEGAVSAPSPAQAADRAWEQMILGGQTFWTAVYDVLMERELTKTDVRNIVKRGLQHTRGSYRDLMTLFHLSPRENRRFLAVLHQHNCHVTPGSTRPMASSEETPVGVSKSA